MYHDLGLRFLSPTINLFMKPADFVRFCSNLQHYLTAELKETDSNEPYPCGNLDGLSLHFVHYNSFNEAKTKWVERARRVNLSNLCVIMVDRDGCGADDAKAFDALPIECKAFLTARHMDGVACEIVRPEWAEDSHNAESVRDLCAFRGGILSTVRWLDDWDYVGLLNQAGGICEH